jgi:hypothetical protein
VQQIAWERKTHTTLNSTLLLLWRQAAREKVILLIPSLRHEMDFVSSERERERERMRSDLFALKMNSE